jgi:hypothetical protein
MHRSAGVTASAVVVIVGSVFTILCGALMLLGSAAISKSSPPPNLPVSLGSVLIVEAILTFAFGAWGLASGIGLIYLKQWARISLLVFAGFLACITVPAVAMMAVIRLPDSHDPNLPANFMTVMRIGMALFYGMFAALGVFWLYFFNKRSVKAQFQTMLPVPETTAGDSFLGTALPAPIASERARPLSITIISWFLLVGSAIAPLGLLMNRFVFPGVQVPLYFLGFFVYGRNAYVVFIMWMAAQMAAAVGLLKLRNWGLSSAIALQCLGAINATLLLVIPGHREKFQRIMESMMASMNARMPQSAPFEFPMWIGFVAVFPIALVVLWFLITRRHAFASAAQESASKSS